MVFLKNMFLAVGGGVVVERFRVVWDWFSNVFNRVLIRLNRALIGFN